MQTTRIGLALGLLTMVLVGCGAAEGRTAAQAPEAPAGYPASSAYGGSRGAAEAQPGLAASPPSADAPSAAFAASAPTPASVPATAPTPAPAKTDASPSAAAVAPRAIARRLPESGQLTAGVWDDNRNFDFFKPYAATFAKNNGADFAMFADQELTTARDRANQAQQGRSAIDVQLILDTTGSMGDELAYLQGEFVTIASKLHARFPNVTPRWSLVLYRDKGDDYVTRTFDFTTDASKFQRDLRAQSAAGGGDTPEAVVEGLSAGLHLGWRQQDANVAKMAFWVADAPTHPGEGPRLAGILRDAQKKGVHIYPIAASDTDEAAEYQMRSAAQLTGGRYVFLTNDSGVGNDHAEPHIPCYNVSRLDSAIVRMVEVELLGRHVEPEASEVLRSVGRPNRDGKCQLPSGMLVASY